MLVFSLLGLQFQQAFAKPYQEPQTPENPFGEGVGENIELHAVTGKINFVEGTIDEPAIGNETISSFGSGSAEITGQSFLIEYGELFGLNPETDTLELIYQNKPDNRREIVRFQQYHLGVPVLGAQLNIQVTPSGQIISVNGEALPVVTVSTNPQIDAQKAAEVSRDYLSGTSSDSVWSTQDNSLWIYSPEILESIPGEQHLVWKITNSSEGLQLNKIVLVDANSGDVLKTYEERKNISIHVYDTSLGSNTCELANCTDGDTDAQKAYSYFTDVYNFFSYLLERDSYDNGIDGNGTGATISVETHVSGVQANWNGNKFQFGTGWTFADDVIAHEFAHALDDYSSKLYPWYQSGAIGESFADIWGEFVDQVFVRDGENPADNWKIGEDLVPATIPSVIRDLQNPSVATMDSYLVTDANNGGIHTNNGIGNRAAYLVVNDSTYGIGLAKAIAVYYEAQANLLTSGSDYYDLYKVLYQACRNVEGVKWYDGLEGSQDLLPTTVIVTEDCNKLREALKLVKMNTQLAVSGPKDDAPLLDSTRTNIETVFADDFESGESQWTFQVISGSTQLWKKQITEGILYGKNAHSGEFFMVGDAYDANTDSALRMASAVTIPDNGYLYFYQSYILANGLDGGIVEYSTNSGSSWTQVPANWFDYNGYDSTMTASSLSGKMAFTGNSRGYFSSRVNLATLAGQSVLFRWRLATDGVASDSAWWIDDVKIYNQRAPYFNDISAPWDRFAEALKDAGVTSGCGREVYCPNKNVTRAQMAVFLVTAIHYGESYTVPPATGTKFSDVPANYWAAKFIEELARTGITSGCGGGKFCPDKEVTRAQMAVFLLAAKYGGSGYVYPPATGVFADVPTNYWAGKHIEQLARDGVTSGCGGGKYCPDQVVTRAQMAVFLASNFNFPVK
jgi:Zn-dependent metalloprotease